MISESQAVSEIRKIIDPTMDDLVSIVSRTRARVLGNADAWFYSGALQDIHSSDVIVSINNFGNETFTIEDTDVGKLIRNPELEEVIDMISMKTGLSVGEILTGYTDNNQGYVPGLWDYASINYAKAATGDIRIVTMNPSPDSTFLLYEWPELLKNTKITSINGIPVDLLPDDPTDALLAVRAGLGPYLGSINEPIFDGRTGGQLLDLANPDSDFSNIAKAVADRDLLPREVLKNLGYIGDSIELVLLASVILPLLTQASDAQAANDAALRDEFLGQVESELVRFVSSLAEGAIGASAAVSALFIVLPLFGLALPATFLGSAIALSVSLVGGVVGERFLELDTLARNLGLLSDEESEIKLDFNGVEISILVNDIYYDEELIFGSDFLFDIFDDTPNAIFVSRDVRDITGTRADDYIVGNSGDNTISSGNGVDIVDGKSGPDLLIGGRGSDILAGGDGNDKFIGTLRELNGDTIVDFEGGDQIIVFDRVLSSQDVVHTSDTIFITSGGFTAAVGAEVPDGSTLRVTVQSVDGVDSTVIEIVSDPVAYFHNRSAWFDYAAGDSFAVFGDGEVYYLDNVWDTQALQDIFENERVSNGSTQTHLSTMLQDQNGVSFVATFDGPNTQFNSYDRSFVRVSYDIQSGFSLLGNINHDESESIWFNGLDTEVVEIFSAEILPDGSLVGVGNYHGLDFFAQNSSGALAINSSFWYSEGYSSEFRPHVVVPYGFSIFDTAMSKEGRMYLATSHGIYRSSPTSTGGSLDVFDFSIYREDVFLTIAMSNDDVLFGLDFDGFMYEIPAETEELILLPSEPLYSTPFRPDERDGYDFSILGSADEFRSLYTSRPIGGEDVVDISGGTYKIISVLSNDKAATISDLDPSTLKISEQPDHGSVEVEYGYNSYFVYTPDEGYSGLDQFSYTIATESGIVSDEIIVTARIASEAMTDTFLSWQVGEIGQPHFLDVLSNDKLGENNSLLEDFGIVFDPGGGSVSVGYDSEGTLGIYYTANRDSIGIDEFRYRIRDQFDNFSEASVYVDLRVSDDFSAVDDEVLFAGGPAESRYYIDVMANDSILSENPNPIGVQIVNAPSFGSVQVAWNATFDYPVLVYYPGSDVMIPDSFSYSIIDSEGVYSNVATVSLVERTTTSNGGKTIGSNGDDNIVGNPEGNVIVGLRGSDTILGLGGDDTLRGGIGNDYLDGGDGNDILIYDAGLDFLYGGDGENTFDLRSTSVYSTGQFVINADSLGQIGTQMQFDLEGLTQFETVIRAGSYWDSVNLTEGNDAFMLHDVYSGYHDSVELTIDQFGHESTARFSGIDEIFAGNGDDFINLTSPDYLASYGALVIRAGRGDDVIWGSSASEAIFGGPGSDVIFGGAASDVPNVLYGGIGADVFEFTRSSGSTIIDDFDLDEGDILRFYSTGEASFDLSSFYLTDEGFSIGYVDNNTQVFENLSVELRGVALEYSVSDFLGSIEVL